MGLSEGVLDGPLRTRFVQSKSQRGDWPGSQNKSNKYSGIRYLTSLIFFVFLLKMNFPSALTLNQPDPPKSPTHHLKYFYNPFDIIPEYFPNFQANFVSLFVQIT
jgi:hypothetical protein